MSRVDEFDIVIRRKNGAVAAGIPQLGLYAKGGDVGAALDSLEVKKKAFVADLEEAGELEMLEAESTRAPSVRSGTTRGTGSVGDLGLFAIKGAIVVCFIVAAFAVSGALIASKVEQSVENTVNNIKSIKIGGAQFWGRLEAEVDRLARPDSELPEAKKQKLLADIRVIVGRLQPFVAEAQSALAEPTGSSRTPAAPTSK